VPTLRWQDIDAGRRGRSSRPFRTPTPSPPSSQPSTPTSGSYRPRDLPSRTRRSRAPRPDSPAFADNAEQGPTAPWGLDLSVTMGILRPEHHQLARLRPSVTPGTATKPRPAPSSNLTLDSPTPLVFPTHSRQPQTAREHGPPRQRHPRNQREEYPTRRTAARLRAPRCDGERFVAMDRKASTPPTSLSERMGCGSFATTANPKRS